MVIEPGGTLRCPLVPPKLITTESYFVSFAAPMTTEPHMTVLAGSIQPGTQAAPQPGLAPAQSHRQSSAKHTRERVVLICMALVTAASAATLYALLDFPLASSVLTGGLIWAALMTLHMQMKKSSEIAQLKAELARLEASQGGASHTVSAKPGHEAPVGEAENGAKPRPAAARRPAIAATGGAHGSSTKAADPVADAAAESVSRPAAGARPAAASATVSSAIEQPHSLNPHPRWEMPATQSRAAPRAQNDDKAADRSASLVQGRNAAHQGAAGHGVTNYGASAPSGATRTPSPVETALWPGTSLSTADPMRDHWAFRPKDAVLPASQQTAQAGVQAVAHPGSNADDYTSSAPPPSTIDADLEMVQRKIKALADEVNAAELLRDRQPSASGAAPHTALEKSIGALKATAVSMRDRASSSQTVSSGGPASAGQGSAIPSSIAPPRQMQPQSLPFELMIPATAERIAVSDPGNVHQQSLGERVDQGMDRAPALGLPGYEPVARANAEPSMEQTPVSQSVDTDAHVHDARDLPAFELPPLPVFEFASAPPPPNPRLAAIIAAVENGAMDVFLSPIVALQSHQVSHYDVTVRLKSVTGAYLDDAEQELQLAGSDVLALFDTARLKRSAALAQRLDAHNKSGSLLSPVNGPSITNGEFLETFARVYEERDRISNQLVLTFSQADLEQFSPSAWQALSDMHAFGFRFALSKIDHVAMDFASLAARGFAFLRLDASALINGLPARDRFMGPDDLCKHLAGAGMTLVADTIDDEAIRARVFGFGVLFGQGRLFGGARQVKLDALPAGSSAAA